MPTCEVRHRWRRSNDSAGWCGAGWQPADRLSIGPAGRQPGRVPARRNSAQPKSRDPSGSGGLAEFLRYHHADESRTTHEATHGSAGSKTFSRGPDQYPESNCPAKPDLPPSRAANARLSPTPSGDPRPPGHSIPFTPAPRFSSLSGLLHFAASNRHLSPALLGRESEQTFISHSHFLLKPKGLLDATFRSVLY